MREWNASLRVYLDVAKAAVDNAESKASQQWSFNILRASRLARLLPKQQSCTKRLSG
jgi:hypothetical protein